MSIVLFLQVGYLIAWDDYGVAFGWGIPRLPRKPRDRAHRIYWEHPFPWWMQPAKIKQALLVRNLRRRAGKS